MDTVLDRFKRYVKIDTQSDPHSKTFPSTEKQKNLSRLLVKELLEIGLSDAAMDENGYVYATIPSNIDKKVPVICFCSHVDTSPDSSGKDVKPLVHTNYDGRDLVLPDDPNVVIKLAEHPDLREQMGHDIVTASGTTLLGADDKAGIAEIMTAAAHLITHPEIPHGTIKVLFTPDEEIGRGVDYVDLKRLGADFAYTMDGSRIGSMEDETFSADGMTVTIKGVSAHPGFAKDKMISSMKIAGAFLDALPKDRLTPEATSGREGFVHPVEVSGNVEETIVRMIVRDFDTSQLEVHAAEVRAILDKIIAQHPGTEGIIEIKEQYRNMKDVLVNYPDVADNAAKAIKRAGLNLIRSEIRGGTDGSRLSFMGLPCPNIFTGGHAFHSKKEWVTVQDMEKASEVIVHLVQIWAES